MISNEREIREELQKLYLQIAIVYGKTEKFFIPPMVIDSIINIIAKHDRSRLPVIVNKKF